MDQIDPFRELLFLDAPCPKRFVDFNGSPASSFLIPSDETFDVGVDTLTPVDDNDYQVPFHFTGKIAKLTFKLEPEQMTEADRKVMHQYVIRGKD